jgi:adenylate kinase family enzyme
MRASVIGTSCSGKTTFSRRLSQLYNLEHIELDALYWLPEWQVRPLDDFRALTLRAAAGEAWVIDGNYHSVRDLVWGRATHIYWLNYPFPVVFWRAFHRTLKRVINQEELFSGNRENWRQAVFSKDSILWWVITTHNRRKRTYRQIFNKGYSPGVTWIELTTPRQASRIFS